MIVNLDKFNLKLDKLASIDTIQKGLWNACALVEGEAKKNCPQGGTGTLWRSIQSRVNGLVGEVYSDAEYAIYVHQGTGNWAFGGAGRESTEEHPIPWVYTPDGGETFYTTYGQEPNPFLERALDQNKVGIQQAFDKAIKEAVE